MKGKVKLTVLLINLAGLLTFTGCDKNNDDDIIVITATGDIAPKLQEFRNILGVKLNVVPGAVGGHREINWDGIPDELVNKALPGDFFNATGDGAPTTRQRGLTYTGDNGEFRVSNNGFAEVNAAAAAQFSAFSGDKAFANISNSLWDSEFRVPGQTTLATVHGFGVVLSDVDQGNTTFIEFFSDTRSLGKFYAPAKTSESNFSFLGVYFKNEKVTRVRIGHDGSLSEGKNDISNGGPRDLIVLDDFLYDEPVKK